MSGGDDAAAFAAHEAIRSGAWDRHLVTLGVAIRERARASFDERERAKTVDQVRVTSVETDAQAAPRQE